MNKEKDVLVSISLDELVRLRTKAAEQKPKKVQPQLKIGKRLLTQKNIEGLLQVSRQTVYNWRKAGLIPEHRINGRLYFFEDEVLNAVRQSDKNSKAA